MDFYKYIVIYVSAINSIRENSFTALKKFSPSLILPSATKNADF